MKKLAVLALSLLMVASSFTMFASAAKDGDIIVHDKFDGSLKLDYTDKEDNYDVVVKDGRLELTSMNASKLYLLPYEGISGVEKFTIEYDYEFISNTAPTNAGHTLYFVFGAKDANNGMYVGFSNINGSEHLGSIIEGTWARKYRSHYYADDGVTKSSSAVLGKNTFNVKIEVDGVDTRVYIDGNRFILADKGEDWRDAAQVVEFFRDGKFGLVSRGVLVVTAIDNLVIRHGVNLPKFEEAAATTATTTTATPVTTATGTTTAKPVTTKGETTSPVTSDSTIAVVTVAMMLSGLAVVVLRKKATAK